MTARERFLATTGFGQPDRVPFWPGAPRKSTLDTWRKQGMPNDVYYASYFGYDHQEGLPIDMSPVPRFEEIVLEERGQYKVWIDEQGAKRLDFKVDATPGFVTRTWLEFPVKDRESFLQMRERFVPKSLARYPEWWEAKRHYWQGRDFVLSLTIPSLFWRVRDWVGFEGLCTMFYDDPNLVHEMMEFVADFAIETLRRAVSEVEIDYVYLNEDMAYKTASMVSPQMVREFMWPPYRRLVGFLRSHGIETIIMDSDGHVHELIPLWLEVGINGISPLEIAAGNDPIFLRKKYGHNLVMMGGIDKRELSKDREAIEAEVMSKVPWLLRQGGYIPTVDHGVPPDIPYDNFLYYLDLTRRLVVEG